MKSSTETMIAKGAVWLSIIVIGFLLSGALSNIATNADTGNELVRSQAVFKERMDTHIDGSIEAMKKLQATLEVNQSCIFKIQLNQPCN